MMHHDGACDGMPAVRSIEMKPSATTNYWPPCQIWQYRWRLGSGLPSNSLQRSRTRCLDRSNGDRRVPYGLRGVAVKECRTVIRHFQPGCPFLRIVDGQTRDEILEQITTLEARPPRQWDDSIPKELERICLKASPRKPPRASAHCWWRHRPGNPGKPFPGGFVEHLESHLPHKLLAHSDALQRQSVNYGFGCRMQAEAV
jgi:hypothetical protein